MLIVNILMLICLVDVPELIRFSAHSHVGVSNLFEDVDLFNDGSENLKHFGLLLASIMFPLPCHTLEEGNLVVG